MGKYHKGDKFIIEIQEVINSENGTLYRSNFKTLVFDDYGLDSLHQAITPAEDGLVDKAEVAEAYNKGLQDAWELARKIVLDVSKGGIPERNMRSMFGEKWTVSDILKNYTPQEVLAKLEAYEKEQNEIKVGDVVSNDGLKSVVVRVVEDKIYTVTSIGTTPSYAFDDIKKLKKTGKHIDIQNILQQIGGGENVI